MYHYERGLVVGKMYPPHKGHMYLIETAAFECRQVYVLVTDTPVEGWDINVHQRAEWVAEAVGHLPNVLVRAVPDLNINDYDPASHGYWADYTIALMQGAPDAVFSSEEYGKPWADAMGAKHILVDIDRLHVPISATMVRMSAHKALDMLPDPVRHNFVPRIVVIGAESSGTTTLARQLADYYNEPFVYEYGRYFDEEHVRKHGHPVPVDGWTVDMFKTIWRTQDALEENRARSAKRLVVCDTDSFATAFWWDRYYPVEQPDDGSFHDEIWRNAGNRVKGKRLYLVTSPEFYVQDPMGTRIDGPHRDAMHYDIWTTLELLDADFAVLKGDEQTRLETAIELIEEWLDE